MDRHLLSRRKWLGLAERTSNEEALELAALPAVTSGISPYTGTFGQAELLHLLKRALFGVTKADLNGFAGKSLNQVVDLLLTVPTTLSSFPLNNYANPDTTKVALGSTWVNSVTTSETENNQRRNSLLYWNIGNCLNQNASIFEKLVFFWHNHFSVDVNDVTPSKAGYLYVKTLRENVGAGLKDLCFKMTKDLAMLSYLNGELNKKNAPDENYSRELQELFTVGKVLPTDQRYTEDDVKAAARVLTGHGSVGVGYDAVYGFNLSNHDTTDKQFSSFYNNKIIKGRNTSTAGDDELNDLLDMIFSTEKIEGRAYSTAEVVAHHMMEKVYRFFVYYEIDDTIQTNVIIPLAKLYVQNDFQLLPVLKTLFTSQHFFDMSNRGCFIKTPLDVTVGLCRTLGVTINDTDVKARYAKYNMLWSTSDALLLAYLSPPNIAGLPAFYQTPNFHQLWINSNTLPLRQNFAKRLVSSLGVTGTYSGIAVEIKIDPLAFIKTLKNPSDPNELINELSDLLLGIVLSDDHKTKIKTDFLLTGQLTDSYWTSAWTAAIATNATDTLKSTAANRVLKLLDYLVSIEEFQLC